MDSLLDITEDSSVASPMSSASDISRRHSRRPSIIHVLPPQPAPPPNIRNPLELLYPRLYQFLNRPQEWDAPLQLIKVTLDILNDKRVFSSSPRTDALEDLKQRYRAWWTIVKNNPQLQDPTIMKLARLVKEFLITALEDTAYVMRLSIAADKGQVPFRESPKTDVDRVSSKSSIAKSPQGSPKLEDTFTLPKFQPTQAEEQPPPKVEDEIYMQMIMKDILHAISTKEAAARKKKLTMISDRGVMEEERGLATHRVKSSASVLGAKKISMVTSKLGISIPNRPIRQSRVMYTSYDGGMKYPTGTITPKSEFKNKIEGLKVKLSENVLKGHSVQSTKEKNALKEKVLIKLRTNPQFQEHVRPLGKL